MKVNNKYKGELGEIGVIYQLIKLHIPISIPYSDNFNYDLIIEINNKLYKVQVKSSTIENSKDSVIFDLRTNNWYKRKIIKNPYKDIDIIICYDINKELAFLLLKSDFDEKQTFTIKYKKCKNNQIKNVHYYNDFLLDKRLKKVFAN